MGRFHAAHDTGVAGDASRATLHRDVTGHLVVARDTAAVHDGSAATPIRAIGRLVGGVAIAAVVVGAVSGCGELQDFGGPTPPLATIQLQVTGEVPASPSVPPPVRLQVALVYGAQWLTEPLCYLPPPSADVEMVVAAGCRDTFGFVPDRVGAVIDITPNVATTLELAELPSADVMVGDVTARVAYASFVVYDDRDRNGTLSFSRPRNTPSDGMDGSPADVASHDVVYGASFFSMTAPDQRLAFREGGFNANAAFYPRSGCGEPLPGFSIVTAGGFSIADALAAILAGKLPPEDPATCSELPTDATTVTIPLRAAGEVREVACDERRTDSSVRYREPEATPPFLAGHAMACTTIPDFGGGNSGVIQLVVASHPADRCQGLTHYVLTGCNNDPLCALPMWDHSASPPSWWPCPVGAVR